MSQSPKLLVLLLWDNLHNSVSDNFDTFSYLRFKLYLEREAWQPTGIQQRETIFWKKEISGKAELESVWIRATPYQSVQEEQECCQRKWCKARRAWTHFAYWTFVFSLQSNESTFISHTFTSRWVPAQIVISTDLGLCNKLVNVHWYRWLPSHCHCPLVFALSPCYVQVEAYLFLQVLIIP